MIIHAPSIPAPDMGVLDAVFTASMFATVLLVVFAVDGIVEVGVGVARWRRLADGWDRDQKRHERQRAVRSSVVGVAAIAGIAAVHLLPSDWSFSSTMQVWTPFVVVTIGFAMTAMFRSWDQAAESF